MTLSEFIMDNTNDGLDIVRVLVNVMNGFIRGVKVSHQLTAARLLTIYGYQDARDFIDENVLHPSDENREWVISDPELSRLIRARTNDGGDVCLFLIDVMHGEVEGIRIGHRVSAAKELLDRAFGRSQGLPMPIPPPVTAPRGTILEKDYQVAPSPSRESVRPRIESEAGSEPSRREPVDPELVEGQSVPPAQTQVQTETDQQVESSTESARPEPSRRELAEGQPEPEAAGDFDPDIYRGASRCIDPNFDPMRAATDDDYFWNYDGCDNISCPYHGDPEDPDYNPNAHHY